MIYPVHLFSAIQRHSVGLHLFLVLAFLDVLDLLDILHIMTNQLKIPRNRWTLILRLFHFIGFRSNVNVALFILEGVGLS
jgi:hypothetical protein